MWVVRRKFSLCFYRGLKNEKEWGEKARDFHQHINFTLLTIKKKHQIRHATYAKTLRFRWVGKERKLKFLKMRKQSVVSVRRGSRAGVVLSRKRWWEKWGKDFLSCAWFKKFFTGYSSKQQPRRKHIIFQKKISSVATLEMTEKRSVRGWLVEKSIVFKMAARRDFLYFK